MPAPRCRSPIAAIVVMLLFQALILAMHQGARAANDASVGDTILICVGGVIERVKLRPDGTPEESPTERPGTHECSICIVSSSAQDDATVCFGEAIEQPQTIDDALPPSRDDASGNRTAATSSRDPPHQS
ncbi:MAG: hypothetical protein AAFZ01_08305 [Pseudomonadota bacterium]